jgi:hypothetical protein
MLMVTPPPEYLTGRAASRQTRVVHRRAVFGGRRRQGAAISQIQCHGLFDELAQSGKDRLFVIAVASTVEQFRTTANEALIFV